MLAGVLLPLVNEESRNAVDLPLHILGAGPDKAKVDHEYHALGHYNNTIHFVHHDNVDSATKTVRRRTGQQGVENTSDAGAPDSIDDILYEDDL